MRRSCATFVPRSPTDEPNKKKIACLKPVKTSTIILRQSHTLSVTSLLETSTERVKYFPQPNLVTMDCRITAQMKTKKIHLRKSRFKFMFIALFLMSGRQYRGADKSLVRPGGKEATFPAFYGTWRFITTFTRVHHLSLPSQINPFLCPSHF